MKSIPAISYALYDLYYCRLFEQPIFQFPTHSKKTHFCQGLRRRIRNLHRSPHKTTDEFNTISRQNSRPRQTYHLIRQSHCTKAARKNQRGKKHDSFNIAQPVGPNTSSIDKHPRAPISVYCSTARIDARSNPAARTHTHTSNPRNQAIQTKAPRPASNQRRGGRSYPSPRDRRGRKIPTQNRPRRQLRIFMCRLIALIRSRAWARLLPRASRRQYEPPHLVYARRGGGELFLAGMRVVAMAFGWEEGL